MAGRVFSPSHFFDESGQYHPIGSGDVNDHLRLVSGEVLTAKDFRTWWGSVLTLQNLRIALAQDDDRSTKKLLADAIVKTADALGHTKAVCRQSYIHPGLIRAAESGKLSKLIQKNGASAGSSRAELTRDEELFLAILPALRR